jgi:hypothetical protein
MDSRSRFAETALLTQLGRDHHGTRSDGASGAFVPAQTIPIATDYDEASVPAVEAARMLAAAAGGRAGCVVLSGAKAPCAAEEARLSDWTCTT